MAYPNGSIPVTSSIGTTASSDTFPTHIDNLGAGGLMTMLTVANMNSIPTARRKFGMQVSVTSDTTPANNKVYILANVAMGGTDNSVSNNSNWIEYSSFKGASPFEHNANGTGIQPILGINTANGCFATIGGGNNNTTNSNNSVIGGGANNVSGKLSTYFQTCTTNYARFCTNSGCVYGNVNFIAPNFSYFCFIGNQTTYFGIPDIISGLNLVSPTNSFSCYQPNTGFSLIGAYYNPSTQNTCVGFSPNLFSEFLITQYSDSFIGGGNSNLSCGKNSVVVGGLENNALCKYSTIGGGGFNTASCYRSTVGGGYCNTASGNSSTIGGGGFNTASCYNSTIGGGYRNTASNCNSTIGGGCGNTASNCNSTIGGGCCNTASGGSSTVSGGIYNLVDTCFSFIGGGCCNIICGGGGASIIVGGQGNYLCGNQSVIIGGICNILERANCSVISGGNLNRICSNNVYTPLQGATISGGLSNRVYACNSSILGGYQNILGCGSSCSSIGGGRGNGIALSQFSFIGGGLSNGIVSSCLSFIGSGFCNFASGLNTTIGGGYCNTTSGTRSVIIGGCRNTSSGSVSTIGGGYRNISSGCFSTVSGGCFNFAISSNSFIAGGSSNTTCSFDCAMLIGSNLTADRVCTTFVNNLSIKNIPTSASGLPSGSVWRSGSSLCIVP